MKNVYSIHDFNLQGQRLFLRLDLNVPLSEPDADGNRKVIDDNRIRQALPVIQYAIEKEARIILSSHLGRPDGKSNPKYSLEPIALLLAEFLETDVILAEDYLSEGFEMMVQSMKPGNVILLENLRFHGEEESNDIKFCHALARFTDIYINDAFGTAHRKHASIYGLPKIVENKGIGLLIEKELKFLDVLIQEPKKPFHVILGGAKVSDKIKTINRLMKNVDVLLIGGAMAHAFTKAKGDTLPDNALKPSNEDIVAVRSILKNAEKNELTILLPEDMIQSYDIGPKTIQKFGEKLKNAKTIFWNGPLGWFEKEEYANGTNEIAKIIAEIPAVKIIGGGDTVSAIKQLGLADRFEHLSTGGGAVLKYLEGNGLPGIDVLAFNPNRMKPSVLSPEEE